VDLPDDVNRHCAEVTCKGKTVIRGDMPAAKCKLVIEDFCGLEDRNAGIFTTCSGLNTKHLAVSDALFGKRTSFYTSPIYETGSQQPIHPDTPVFSTRREYP
jgi:hypothetical protein